jgi:hypothetical protein
MLRAMKHAATVAVSASPIVTFGALQMLGSSATPQWSTIGIDLVDARFWLTIVVMLLGGAFGGVSYELLLRGGAIELPHRVKPDSGGRSYAHAPAETLVALGTVGRAIVGAAAALSVLLVASPASAHSAIALAVTAGAAAPALIRLLRRQLMTAADVLGRVNRDRAHPTPTPDALRAPTAAPAGRAA